MCGRYTITITLDDLYEIFQAENFGNYDPSVYKPRYNIAPTQLVPAIIGSSTGRRLGLLKWGLVPAWAKDARIASQTINARCETLTEKPAFRSSFLRKRCLIPADGFYEWKRSGSAKQPYRIVMTDRPAFAMAGLYDTWIDPQGEKVSSCTIITTTPNPLMAEIHDRMPVILDSADEEMWLDRGNQNPAALKGLLVPYDAARMRVYKVSDAVGNVRNTGPELIEELA